MTDQIVQQPAFKNGTNGHAALAAASGSTHVQLLALGVIAWVLVGSSAWKFRGQTR